MMNLEDVFAQYRAAVLPELPVARRYRVEQELNSIGRVMGARKVDAVTSEDVRAVFSAFQPGYQRRLLRRFERVFGYASRCHYCKGSPVAGVDVPPIERAPRRRILTADETAALLAAWDECTYNKNRRLLRLLLMTGLRWRDFGRMRVTDIGDGVVLVQRCGWLRLSPEALALLHEQAGVVQSIGGHLFGHRKWSYVGTRLVHASKIAGIERVVPTHIRCTHMANSLRAGETVDEVLRRLGTRFGDRPMVQWCAEQLAQEEKGRDNDATHQR